MIELLAFHLHRLSGVAANVVTITADGRQDLKAIDWVIAQARLEPARVVEALDWCHGVHHLSLALQASGLSEEDRTERWRSDCVGR